MRSQGVSQQEVARRHCCRGNISRLESAGEIGKASACCRPRFRCKTRKPGGNLPGMGLEYVLLMDNRERWVWLGKQALDF